MIDVTSVEFYTLAFVVAMALVALLIGKRDKGTPSTHIVQLLTTTGGEDDEDTLRLERQQGGRVRLTRTGLSLGTEETVNLVFTISDDHCTIVEKKGIKRRGSKGEPVSGEVTVKCLRPIKYHMRFDSQVTSTWATFTYDAASQEPKEVKLSF